MGGESWDADRAVASRVKHGRRNLRCRLAFPARRAESQIGALCFFETQIRGERRDVSCTALRLTCGLVGPFQRANFVTQQEVRPVTTLIIDDRKLYRPNDRKRFAAAVVNSPIMKFDSAAQIGALCSFETQRYVVRDSAFSAPPRLSCDSISGFHN